MAPWPRLGALTTGGRKGAGTQCRRNEEQSRIGFFRRLLAEKSGVQKIFQRDGKMAFLLFSKGNGTATSLRADMFCEMKESSLYSKSIHPFFTSHTKKRTIPSFSSPSLSLSLQSEADLASTHTSTTKTRQRKHTHAHAHALRISLDLESNHNSLVNLLPSKGAACLDTSLCG